MRKWKAKKFRPTKSITELLAELRAKGWVNPNPDVYLSSADIDPAFNPNAARDLGPRGPIGAMAFDPSLNVRTPSTPNGLRGDIADHHAKSAGFSEPEGSIGFVHQAFGGSGYGVYTLKGNQEFIPRRTTPWWLNSPAAARLMRELGRVPSKDYILSGALNYQILILHYIHRYEDADIYRRLRYYFKKESSGKRGTKSPKGVKDRRLRLVDIGFEMFGTDNWSEISAELWRDIREGPIRFRFRGLVK